MYRPADVISTCCYFVVCGRERSVKLPKWYSSLALMRTVADATQPITKSIESLVGGSMLQCGVWEQALLLFWTGSRSPSSLQLSPQVLTNGGRGCFRESVVALLRVVAYRQR